MPRKPRLVFFQPNYSNRPPFIQLHSIQHVACLSYHFDVTVVRESCDYNEICDKVAPDLALFESGVYRREPVNISNARSNAQIPKLGLLNADAYCRTRSLFMADMERWDIDTYFTISMSMAEYFPEIHDQLFTWANCIDPEVCKDYYLDKSAIAIEIGSHAAHYPWRTRINKLIASHYDIARYPHFGWFDGQEARGIVHGQAYAMILNSAFFVPTCGTIAKEIVRKHFEIPGSRSCLVTEKTAALKAAGFIDMQNCIFVDESDALDKIDLLLRDSALYECIVSAGYSLTHSRHTMAARSEILDWYQLNAARKPGERIVQTQPFAGLQIISATQNAKNVHVISGGVDRAMLDAALANLTAGSVADAEKIYRQVQEIHFIPEARLGLVRCYLLSGRPYMALMASMPHMDAAPDPVEWAYLIVSLLCVGDVKEALARANQFPELLHAELDRLRSVLEVLSSSSIQRASDLEARPRRSIHSMREVSFDDFVAQLVKMTKACGQHKLSSQIASIVTSSFHPGQRSSQSVIRPPRDFPPNFKYYRMRSFIERGHHKMRRRLRRALAETIARVKVGF